MLPRATLFNEIVTLDLKQFGNKYVLWCIDAFTRFVQGKLLNNKKPDMIVNALEVNDFEIYLCPVWTRSQENYHAGESYS